MGVIPFSIHAELFQRRDAVKRLALDSFVLAPVMEIEMDFSLRSKLRDVAILQHAHETFKIARQKESR